MNRLNLKKIFILLSFIGIFIPGLAFAFLDPYSANYIIPDTGTFNDSCSFVSPNPSVSPLVAALSQAGITLSDYELQQLQDFIQAHLSTTTPGEISSQNYPDLRNLPRFENLDVLLTGKGLEFIWDKGHSELAIYKISPGGKQWPSYYQDHPYYLTSNYSLRFELKEGDKYYCRTTSDQNEIGASGYMEVSSSNENSYNVTIHSNQYSNPPNQYLSTHTDAQNPLVLISSWTQIDNFNIPEHSIPMNVSYNGDKIAVSGDNGTSIGIDGSGNITLHTLKGTFQDGNIPTAQIRLSYYLTQNIVREVQNLKQNREWNADKKKEFAEYLAAAYVLINPTRNSDHDYNPYPISTSNCGSLATIASAQASGDSSIKAPVDSMTTYNDSNMAVFADVVWGDIYYGKMNDAITIASAIDSGMYTLGTYGIGTEFALREWTAGDLSVNTGISANIVLKDPAQMTNIEINGNVSNLIDLLKQNHYLILDVRTNYVDDFASVVWHAWNLNLMQNGHVQILSDGVIVTTGEKTTLDFANIDAFKNWLGGSEGKKFFSADPNIGIYDGVIECSVCWTGGYSYWTKESRALGIRDNGEPIAVSVSNLIPSVYL